LPIFLLIVKIGNNGMARECFDRKRCDESLRVCCHDDMHVETILGQKAGEVDCLMRGNRTSYSQHDLLLSSHDIIQTLLLLLLQSWSRSRMNSGRANQERTR